MINIFEDVSRKCVGKTSLFLYFDFNQKIVDTIKLAGDYVYDKKTHIWEFPVSKLSFLIDELTLLDDINLQVLPDIETEKLDLTLDYKTKPFDHQLEGIRWLLNNPNSLLLDEPGLGKTLQIIYTAEELKAQKDIEHCLIICGVNSLKQNWKEEIQRHSNLTCRVIGEKINSKGSIGYSSIRDRAQELYHPIDAFFVIINIESLRDNDVINAIRNSKNKFDMIVNDECHKCKNPSSEQGKNFLKLSQVGSYHYGLTGTLLVNSPLDSFVPLKFIGAERGTWTNYKNFYCNIEKVFGHNQIAGFKNIPLLKNEIDESSLRRTKDILNLPDKIIIPEYIELSDDHKKFYDDLQKGLFEDVDLVHIKATSLLGLVVRSLQASTCPSVLTSKEFKNEKYERAKSLIEEITSNGDKIIIFSRFKDPLYDLVNELKKYNPVICTGDQSQEEIIKNKDRFETDSSCKVMLCTSQKMGTGFTLTAASYAIFLDSDWTPALEEQCEDRIHRIGAKKTVFIYKLIAKNTIDERVQSVLEHKRGMSEYIIDDKEQSQELKQLLGLLN